MHFRCFKIGEGAQERFQFVGALEGEDGLRQQQFGDPAGELPGGRPLHPAGGVRQQQAGPVLLGDAGHLAHPDGGFQQVPGGRGRADEIGGKELQVAPAAHRLLSARREEGDADRARRADLALSQVAVQQCHAPARPAQHRGGGTGEGGLAGVGRAEQQNGHPRRQRQQVRQSLVHGQNVRVRHEFGVILADIFSDNDVGKIGLRLNFMKNGGTIVWERCKGAASRNRRGLWPRGDTSRLNQDEEVL